MTSEHYPCGEASHGSLQWYKEKYHELTKWRDTMIDHLATLKEPSVDLDKILSDRLTRAEKRATMLEVQNRLLADKVRRQVP